MNIITFIDIITWYEVRRMFGHSAQLFRLFVSSGLIILIHTVMYDTARMGPVAMDLKNLRQ